jgi:hypothetical protein
MQQCIGATRLHSTFLLPSLPRLIELCIAPIRADGLTTIAAWEGLAALAIAVVPSLLALIGAARSGVRVLVTAAGRRRSRSDGTDIGIGAVRRWR